MAIMLEKNEAVDEEESARESSAREKKKTVTFKKAIEERVSIANRYSPICQAKEMQKEMERIRRQRMVHMANMLHIPQSPSLVHHAEKEWTQKMEDERVKEAEDLEEIMKSEVPLTVKLKKGEINLCFTEKAYAACANSEKKAVLVQPKTKKKSITDEEIVQELKGKLESTKTATLSAVDGAWDKIVETFSESIPARAYVSYAGEEDRRKIRKTGQAEKTTTVIVDTETMKFFLNEEKDEEHLKEERGRFLVIRIVEFAEKEIKLNLNDLVKAGHITEEEAKTGRITMTKERAKRMNLLDPYLMAVAKEVQAVRGTNQCLKVVNQEDVDPEVVRKAMTSRLVTIMKCDPLSGKVNRIKARWCARGFLDTRDSIRTDAETCSSAAIQMVLQWGLNKDYDLRIYDFTTAFLQGWE